MRRQRNSGVLALGCLGLIILVLVLSLINAWVLMLLWGAIGATFFETGKFRTIGYGTAYLICIALGFVGGMLRGVKTS